MEKRGWFGIIDMTGGNPKTKYSFNPTAIQWWLWLLGKAVAIVVGLWLGVAWVAGDVFDEHLNTFHGVAKPAMRNMVNEQIANHEKSHVEIERVHRIEKHNARVDEKLQSMKEKLETMDASLGTMDKKLDIIIVNGKND